MQSDSVVYRGPSVGWVTGQSAAGRQAAGRRPTGPTTRRLLAYAALAVLTMFAGAAAVGSMFYGSVVFGVPALLDALDTPPPPRPRPPSHIHVFFALEADYGPGLEAALDSACAHRRHWEDGRQIVAHIALDASSADYADSAAYDAATGSLARGRSSGCLHADSGILAVSSEPAGVMGESAASFVVPRTDGFAGPVTYLRGRASPLWRAYVGNELHGVSRAILLDTDVLVTADLAELYDTDLRGAPLGAVVMRDYEFAHGMFMRAHEALWRHYNARTWMFNSGVLLADLDEWRAADVAAAFSDWVILNRSGRLFHLVDQAALNLIFYGNYTRLPARWNVYGLGEHQLDEADSLVDDAAILHWSGPHKPWRPDGTNKRLWSPGSVQH